MKKLFLFGMIFFFLISVSGIPVPVSVQGTAYNLAGEELINPYVSLKNLDNGYFVEGYAGRIGSPGKYVFSVQGDVGNVLELTASDGLNSETIQFELEGVMKNVNIYLNNSNENIPPRILSDPILLAYEDSIYEYEIIVEDDNSLDYSVIGPEEMYFEDNILFWNPTQEHIGFNEVKIFVSDGEFIISQNYTLEVYEVNDKPIIISGPILSAYEDSIYEYKIIAEDEENEILNFSFIGPEEMKLVNNSLFWIPKQENVGEHNISIKVSDGESFVFQNFTLEVYEINDAPIIISNPNTSAYEDSEYEYEIIIEDEDNFEFNISLLEFPEGMKLVNNSLFWIPKQENVGEHNISIKVSDNNLTALQKFVLLVVEINDRPRIISTPENKLYIGKTFSYNIIANDEENNILTYSFIGPDNAELENNRLIWKPKGNQIGNNDFSIRVFDGENYAVQNFVVEVLRRSRSSSVLLQDRDEESNLSSENYEIIGIKTPFEISGYIDSRRPVEIKITNLNSGEEFEFLSNPNFENFYSGLVYGKSGDELSVEIDGNKLTGYVLKDQEINYDTFNELKPLVIIIPLVLFCALFIFKRFKK